MPEAIAEFITKWQAFKTHDGNLEFQSPDLHIVERTRETADRLQEHFEEIHRRLADESGTIRGDLWVRSSKKSAKSALLTPQTCESWHVQFQSELLQSCNASKSAIARWRQTIEMAMQARELVQLQSDAVRQKKRIAELDSVVAANPE